MKEVWKDIKGYEELYQVSNLGNVRSLITNKILRPNTYGEYNSVALFKNKNKSFIRVHRLVAEAFIENPQNLECVNHINENKKDNRESNLEWCTRGYNCNYGKRNEKMSKSKSIYRIVQKDKNGKIVKIWDNAWDLKHLTNYSMDVIRLCCKNKCKTVYGYQREYVLK